MKKEKSKKYSLKVLNDRVLIDPIEPEGYKSESGIVIPDAYEAFYKNLPENGTIVSFGPACKQSWRVGQRVNFAKMATTKLQFEGKTYLIIREYDIDISYET